MKKNGEARQIELPAFIPIHMPRNSANGFVTAFFAVVFGFAMIWHIWWMAILGLAGMIGTLLALAWRDEEEEEISSADIARIQQSGKT